MALDDLFSALGHGLSVGAGTYLDLTEAQKREAERQRAEQRQGKLDKERAGDRAYERGRDAASDKERGADRARDQATRDQAEKDAVAVGKALFREMPDMFESEEEAIAMARQSKLTLRDLAPEKYMTPDRTPASRPYTADQLVKIFGLSPEQAAMVAQMDARGQLGAIEQLGYGDMGDPGQTPPAAKAPPATSAPKRSWPGAVPDPMKIGSAKDSLEGDVPWHPAMQKKPLTSLMPKAPEPPMSVAPGISDQESEGEDIMLQELLKRLGGGGGVGGGGGMGGLPRISPLRGF